MQALIRGEVAAPPIARLIGFTLVEAGPGQAVFEMQAEERHANPMGTLHGGVLCDIGDAAMGFAMASTLGPGESFTTLELKSNHIGTARDGRIVCHATAQHLGRRTQIWDAIVSDESSGKTIALFRCTQMILWPRG